MRQPSRLPVWRVCLRCARPPFLLLAPLCAGLAVLTARFEGQVPATIDVLLVMLAAVLAHAAVNLLNEHHDFASGLDAMTRRTPFSGGSGALLVVPAAATAVWRAAIACLIGVLMVGGWFLWRTGPIMLGYGVAGIGLVITYTGWLTRRPLLCLLAPGLGFGSLMVVGAHQALTGQFSTTALMVSLVPTLGASALLLINQLPDREPDRRAGRHHLAIVLGVRDTARLAAALVLASFLVLPLAWLAGWVPASVAVMWLAAPAAVWLARGLWRLSEDIRTRELTPWLALNVGTLLGSLALLNLGLWLAT